MEKKNRVPLLAALAAAFIGMAFYGGIVITSYSIHYTKLYEVLEGLVWPSSRSKSESTI